MDLTKIGIPRETWAKFKQRHCFKDGDGFRINDDVAGGGYVALFKDLLPDGI